MSAILDRKLVTSEEFEKFEKDCRLDLIQGELVPMPPMPGEEHGDITNTFTVYAGIYVIEKNLGRCFAAETRFIIHRNPDTAIGPDWAFIAKNRLPKKRTKGFSPIVPDALLEVRSPGDTRPEVQRKVQRWLDAGVRVVLELNPATQILTIHRIGEEPQELGIEDTLTIDDVLPGFAFPIARLFEQGTNSSDEEDDKDEE